MIRNDNAQGEYYITDMVRLLSGVRDSQRGPRYRIRAVPVDHPEWVQGFNSPDELLAIQDYVRRQKRLSQEQAGDVVEPTAAQARTVRHRRANGWPRSRPRRPALKRWLRNVYGRHEDLHRQKCQDLAGVLECYGKRFGIGREGVHRPGAGPGQPHGPARRPPRRHDQLPGHRPRDHRRGRAARRRRTSWPSTPSPASSSPSASTSPSSSAASPGATGSNFVNSDWVREHGLRHRRATGATTSRPPCSASSTAIRTCASAGINMALSGNVPIAAGLSSSSTIVVATLQAAIALNNFDLTSQQFIDLCGEGEWFVGSRGGAGDHAAIYLGQRGEDRPRGLSALPRREDHRRPGRLPGGHRQQPRQGGQERIGPRPVQLPASPATTWAWPC